jgi:sugar phosphate permease
MAEAARVVPLSAARKSPRILSIQRWSLALLIAGGALNYIDRATLSVANKLIQEQMGIPVDKMGLLLSAFLWAYAFSQLPVGALIDKYGPRRMLALGLFGWSLAQGAGGFVRSFGAFIVARAGLGMGEAPLFPGGARVVRDWFGVRKRGFATGLCQSAGTFGNLVAFPMLTFLTIHLSWRWMFIIVGAAGIVLALIWWAVHRDPDEVPLQPDEVGYLTEGDVIADVDSPSFAQWGALFAHRTTWGMIAGFFGTVYILWLFTTWLPFYLEKERHMTMKSAGILSAIPYLCGVIGAIFGGWLSDYLTHRGWTPMGSRKVLIACSLFGIAACALGTAYAGPNWLAVALISLSVFLVYVSSSASWATVPIAAPGVYTASLGSIQNFGGYIGGALAPMVTGFIVKATGSFKQALALSAGVSLVAAVAYLSLVRGPIGSRE